MLLAIDVGNTNAVIGCFDDNRKLIDHWRASSATPRTPDEWYVLLNSFMNCKKYSLEDIEGIVIGSVVPKVTSSLERMCKSHHINSLLVNASVVKDIDIQLDNPKEIGADRLANAVAAHVDEAVDTIVVDLGTATTFDIISVTGAYLGGIILPGIEISLEALFDKAAALGKIDLTAPENVVGRSTVEAIRSGATFGYAAQIDGLCDYIEQEKGKSKVVATGGLGAIISPISKKIEAYDPWLTLRGLHIIYDRYYI